VPGETVVLSSGAALQAHVVGSGPPIVLIGGLGDDHTLWDPVLPGLVAGHRCVTFDNRGAGHSSAPREPFVIEAWAQDAHELTHALGVVPAVIVGCSMGGAIAQEWVLHYPADTTGLVLISTWFRTDDALALRLERFIALARSRDAAALEEAMLIACLGEERTQTAMEAVGPDAAPLDLEGFQAQAEACLDHDTSDRLGEIRVPTCVIAGERDALVSSRQARLLATRIPQATLRLVGTGHVPFWEQPDEVLAILQEFLAGLSG
jgi:pimeloyl-ACP methyl ester carboxylesterase